MNEHARHYWVRTLSSEHDAEVGSTVEAPFHWAALFRAEGVILHSDGDGFLHLDEGTTAHDWLMLSQALTLPEEEEDVYADAGMG